MPDDEFRVACMTALHSVLGLMERIVPEFTFEAPDPGSTDDVPERNVVPITNATRKPTRSTFGTSAR